MILVEINFYFVELFGKYFFSLGNVLVFLEVKSMNVLIYLFSFVVFEIC